MGALNLMVREIKDAAMRRNRLQLKDNNSAQ